MPSNHLILCCPLLLLPSIFPRIGLFSNESVLPIRWPKYWSFSFSISLSSEYSGLISFRVDRLGLAASVLQCSAFFMAQLSRMLIVQLKLGRSQSTLSLAGRVGSDCSWVQGIMPTSLSCGLQACGHMCSLGRRAVKAHTGLSRVWTQECEFWLLLPRRFPSSSGSEHAAPQVSCGTDGGMICLQHTGLYLPLGRFSG